MKNEATAQQKLFVDEYLKYRKKNQTQAAINAGYSPKSAASQSSQLLKNPKIIRYLQEREKELEADLRQEFMFDALEARKVMHDIMEDESAADRDRIAAAKDFLDRAGFKPVDKTELSGGLDVTNPYSVLTTEELRKIARSEKHE
ncbi:terminase small subunit [Sporolactobacillus shoreicorticis]|uniref:Terminase small subunit n=1 Tax=Sporolactobacillus shoreicorticis TaxID=1923877 RepID=A0ABW5RYF5_9BACL|nr:terminase small subunit [Sporolactobacillus shoreicorticis]MCO7125101.1 terminase small subunit [Sporolactobacillus shoreicorticis]